MKKSILMLCALVFGVAGPALAQDHPEHPKGSEHPQKSTEMTGGLEATVTGQNICLGCTLAREKGAAAQCSTYGHRHALKVASVSAAGKDASRFKGWVLHYLETDHGTPYIKGHHEEKLTLKGRIYEAERVFEVSGKEKSKDAAETSKTSEQPEHPNK